MLTTDRGAQLDEILDASISDFDIPAAVYERAVARYGHVGDWLSEYWTGSAGGGDVYPQGSFRLGTVVQPIDPRDDYDIDLVCRRDISKESTTQELLKTDVGNALGRYVATGPDGKPQLREGKRCWTLEYPAEPFHMDVLPAVPDRDAAPNGILLTDRELRRWQHSNPIDYASWFQCRGRARDAAARTIPARSIARRSECDRLDRGLADRATPQRSHNLNHLSFWARPVRSWGERRKVPPTKRRKLMPQYLLSVHTVEGEAREPMTEEEMQQSWARISALNEELKSAGAWVFAGALHGPDTATVVRTSDGEVLTTDGPFAEAKEHLGGFYAIEAEDLDAALAWASKATAAVGKPIEVRPFRDDPDA